MESNAALMCCSCLYLAVPQAEPTLRRSSVALQPARQSSAAHFPGLMDTTTNQEPFVGREIRRLNALVAEYAARLEDAEKSRNQSRATSHTLSSKMDTLLGQAATYRELLAQAEKQQSNAEASFAKTLQERDACSNVEIGQLKEALATSGEKIRHLKEALEASDTKILELENLLGASKQKVDTYRKHLGTAKSEKASAEASLNRMIEQVRLDQESQVAASRNALGEIHRLQQESAALRRQVSEYGGRLDRATREKAEVEASLHDRNQNLLAANSDLSSKLAAVEGDLQRLALVEAGTGQLVAMGQMATNAANQMAMENQVLQSVLAHQQAELQNAVAVANSATGLLAAAAAAAANDANRPPNTEQSIVPRSHSSSQALAICPNEDNGTIVASRKKRKNETGGSFLVQETLILQERSIIQNRYYVQEQPGMEEDPAEVSQPTIEIID